MTRLSKAAAYHEAGHAAVSIATGMDAQPVEIREDGSGLSHGAGSVVEYQGQYAVWDYVTYCFSGPYAEARISKVSTLVVLMRHGHDDLAAAKEALTWLVSHGYALDYTAAWQRADAATRSAISREWSAIAAVAERLLIVGRLDAATVAALVGGAKAAA